MNGTRIEKQEDMMPKISVNGVTLAYELFGEGPPVVWTPSGWLPRSDFSYLVAGRLSANYRVLLWDRRNTGASEIAIDDAPGPEYVWADDLHHLLKALNLSPAYLAGRCSGQTVSLIAARRYPADVKGLILTGPPGDDLDLGEPIVDGFCLNLAAVAEEEGMEAVIAHSTKALVRQVSGRSESEDWDVLSMWVADTVTKNPGNRDRLLAMDPKVFAAIMRRWGDWYMSGPGHVHGLSYEDIRLITLPALVAHGLDHIHPRRSAEQLYGVLPNADWVEYSDRYAQEEIDAVEEEGLTTQKIAMVLPFVEEFLQRLESK
jgi:pimeloyl-ACP methyl ester carboxylesterase